MENQINLNDLKLYTIHVICWDGLEYDRDATEDEVDCLRKNGYVTEFGYNNIIVDFRNSSGV